MDLNRIFSLTERLQQELIGPPVWIEEKGVFEYIPVDIKVVCTLKAIRAAQGLQSLKILCQNGLFIDMGVVIRCIEDCHAEIYFMLENYPAQSTNVQNFILAFSEKKIDTHLQSETETIPSQKIHAAMNRVIMGSIDSLTLGKIRSIYKTFSGYVHANYSHIMEIYGGEPLSFNIEGVPSENQKRLRSDLVVEMTKSYVYVLRFMVLKFGLKDIYNGVMSDELLK